MVNDPDFPYNDMNISEAKSIHHSVSSDSLDDFDYKSSDIECLNVELSDNHDDKFINIQSNKTIENENNKSITNQQVAYQNPKTIILPDSTKSLLTLDDDSLKEKVISKEFSHTSKFSEEDDEFIKREVLLRAVPDWSGIGKCINKSPRSCRDRYFNYLSDRILSPIWSMEEDLLLLKLYTSIGPRLLTIYKWFPNHSPSFIRSRCLSICSDYEDDENQASDRNNRKLISEGLKDLFLSEIILSLSGMKSNGSRLYPVILNWSTLLILRSTPNQSIKPSPGLAKILLIFLIARD